MDQAGQKEQKWGFWLIMLNLFCLSSIARLVLKKVMDADETSFKLQLISSAIAMSLTFGIRYLLRDRPWKMKVWVSGMIVIIWLLAYIFVYVALPHLAP